MNANQLKSGMVVKARLYPIDKVTGRIYPVERNMLVKSVREHTVGHPPFPKYEVMGMVMTSKDTPDARYKGERRVPDHDIIEIVKG